MMFQSSLEGWVRLDHTEGVGAKGVGVRDEHSLRGKEREHSACEVLKVCLQYARGKEKSRERGWEIKAEKQTKTSYSVLFIRLKICFCLAISQMAAPSSRKPTLTFPYCLLKIWIPYCGFPITCAWSKHFITCMMIICWDDDHLLRLSVSPARLRAQWRPRLYVSVSVFSVPGTWGGSVCSYWIKVK